MSAVGPDRAVCEQATFSNRCRVQQRLSVTGAAHLCDAPPRPRRCSQFERMTDEERAEALRYSESLLKANWVMGSDPHDRAAFGRRFVSAGTSAYGAEGPVCTAWMHEPSLHTLPRWPNPSLAEPLRRGENSQSCLRWG